MKILFALRLFSGLENSIINKKWAPNGIPTIYKLLEGIEKQHEIKVLLFHKIPSDMQYSNYKEKKDISIKFKQFKNTFVVISSLFNKNLNKSQKIIEEFNFKIYDIGGLFDKFEFLDTEKLEIFAKTPNSSNLLCIQDRINFKMD